MDVERVERYASCSIRLVAGPCGAGAAVLSALGPVGKNRTSLHEETALALTAVMSAGGIRRFIGISAAGIDVPGDDEPLRDRVISQLIRRLGGRIAADK